MKKQLVVVTGMSGAGKNLAIRAFEDLEFYCIDNLPPNLLVETVRLWQKPKVKEQDVAIVVDVRASQFFGEFLQDYAKLGKTDSVFDKAKILFLDASDTVLVRRFKETRRRHPLFEQGKSISDCIKEERKQLAEIREKADKIVDTSNLEPLGLRRQVEQYFGPDGLKDSMVVTVVSFGFKYGVPLDADLVFDVRFLANPHYVDSLKVMDGNAEAVRRYVLSDPLTEPLIERLFDLVEFSIPQYQKEGKAYLTIAIGCTGGRHRSVVVANELGRFLMSRGSNVIVEHRDVSHGGGG
ncbi:MAG: RNase adapter RapZ [Armatimonadota bacterium]|nr:RNase adapter RapZ [Armatimonadota bacterium]